MSPFLTIARGLVFWSRAPRTADHTQQDYAKGTNKHYCIFSFFNFAFLHFEIFLNILSF